MITNYYFTDTEQKKILSSLRVLIDTREQANDHLISYFDQKRIFWKEKKLDYGDYSFMIPALPEMGIMRDISFTSKIAIERKSGLDELASNLTHGRAAFEAELIRANSCKMFLVIESGSWADILAGNYRNRYNEKSYFASLMAFIHRYGIQIIFTTKENAGPVMMGLFGYFLQELIK